AALPRSGPRDGGTTHRAVAFSAEADAPDEAERIVFNGINGATGDYLQRPLTPDEVVELATGSAMLAELETAHHVELGRRHERDTRGYYGLAAGLDSRDMAQTGWGVIFAHDADPRLREALAELLEHRRLQAVQGGAGHYREFREAAGYRTGESKQAFLQRHGIAAGMPADPERGMPYYLLLVGGPAEIPYRFQYELDVEYAVGRIHFDALDEYARYARSVVQAERGEAARPRRAVLFGVRNEDDRATELSADYLIAPLAERLRPKIDPEWRLDVLRGDEAHKDRLRRLLGGDDTPALLFTASHGMGFPKEDPRQRDDQGALLCGDWPGPRHWKREIPGDFYLRGSDIPDDADLAGLIAFHFACYGAGTPRLDDYPHERGLSEQPAIASQPFVARLPQRLLGHPAGGALAVIGHVERAWSYSFLLGAQREQTQVFESTCKMLLDGFPVGAATEYLNDRYAALATALTSILWDVRYGRQLSPTEKSQLASTWTSHNDARSYAIVGDPAVRLQPAAVAGVAGSEARRPVSIGTAEPDRPQPQSLSPADADAGRTSAAPEVGVPFRADLLKETERRYRDLQRNRAVEFETTGSADLLAQNAPEAIEARLRRLGMPADEARALARRVGRSSPSTPGEE
ncbi:MAG: hypothetical protein KY476_21720, partial [Planctomycetes bacterium]|nr:hypothetical protein [Planctomycetota bacterium]